MKNLSFLIIAIMSVAIVSCTVVSYQQESVQTKAQTQLQTREVQTREFDTNDTKLIMKAMINVLQDDGFVIKDANADLGLLSATKEVNLLRSKSNTGSDDFWQNFFESMARGQQRQQGEQTYQKFQMVEASINVSGIGKRSKVRANFQAKILDNQGKIMDVYQVDNAKYYQDFFMKVEKGVFLQKQGF